MTSLLMRDTEDHREPLRILTVCTGNICRSPMAESWLRASVPADVASVRSAGTHALVGRPMDPGSLAMTGRFGGDAAAHSARQLDESMLAEADLVLAMAREHREAVISLRPALARRTFSIIELERLIALERFASLRTLAATVDGSARERLGVLLDVLASRRSDLRPGDGPSLDVIDPYRRGDEAVERTAAQLLPAVESVVELVRTTERRSPRSWPAPAPR
jgi:protein-tyrosine phosphatase